MRTTANEIIDEETTAIYRATILDEDDVAIPLSQITSLTLTLFNKYTETIINNRDDQNVLNANDVTVHATSGLLTWIITPLDSIIENPENAEEQRIAQFTWTYSGGSKRGSHERLFTIRNLTHVT